MAPSRGSTLLIVKNMLGFPAAWRSRWRRAGCRSISSFTETLSNPANKIQSYISRSEDPFLNLSIEDHILRKSPPESTVLFLYINRPCVVIGRNQNPWTEVNLDILNTSSHSSTTLETEPSGIGKVDLVRRRSGGGTVFHDEGNLNWSITCPRNDFTRDKHAEMVVRALRKLGVCRARVNERHDIVLDQGQHQQASDPEDTHRTPYTLDNSTSPRPLKVSGSAYKLTRLRALHHATTLLSSPNLNIIPEYLHSPAKRFIQAKGVESVSSPVGNIGLEVEPFQKRLQEEFSALYLSSDEGKLSTAILGEEMLQVPDIKKGYQELQTEEWMWSQTPQFDLILSTDDDVGISMNVHHGIIKALEFHDLRFPRDLQNRLRRSVVDKKLHEIRNWNEHLQSQLGKMDIKTKEIATRLNELLLVPTLFQEKV